MKFLDNPVDFLEGAAAAIAGRETQPLMVRRLGDHKQIVAVRPRGRWTAEALASALTAPDLVAMIDFEMGADAYLGADLVATTEL